MTATRGQVLTLPLILLLSLSGCVLSPTHNDWVDTKASPISVSGFTIVKGDTIQVQCQAYLYGTGWTDLNVITASENAINAQQGKLYSFSGSVVVPDSCWTPWHSQNTTKLRFKGGNNDGTTYAVFDEDGVDCVIDCFFDGDDYLTISNECRLKYDSGNNVEYVHVNAHEG